MIIWEFPPGWSYVFLLFFCFLEYPFLGESHLKKALPDLDFYILRYTSQWYSMQQWTQPIFLLLSYSILISTTNYVNLLFAHISEEFYIIL